MCLVITKFWGAERGRAKAIPNPEAKDKSLKRKSVRNLKVLLKAEKLSKTKGEVWMFKSTLIACSLCSKRSLGVYEF